MDILEAMKHRRTYASLDSNLQCRYTVNGAIMGSTLSRPGRFRFDIFINDPDTNDPRAKITKMDIVSDGGKVFATYTPETAAPTAHWTLTITDAQAHYFFVRVWDAGGGDSPHPDSAQPVAWLALVWTGVPSPMAPMLTVDEVKSAAEAATSSKIQTGTKPGGPSFALFAKGGVAQAHTAIPPRVTASPHLTLCNPTLSR